MLSDTEQKIIKKLYPGLSLIKKDGKYFLTGELEFRASYDKDKDILSIIPGSIQTEDDFSIKDKYKIEVELPTDFPRAFPLVRETNGRIQKIATKYNIKDIRDLHVNKDKNNAVCLCPKPAERLKYPDKVDIVHFLNNLVVPFFFGLSHYDLYGKWPWNEYGHGYLGILEFYSENKDLKDMSIAKLCYECLSDTEKELITMERRIKGHYFCVCGSKEIFKRCHKKALEGIWALKEMLGYN